MIRVPTHREPTHPGDMLLEEFLKPMALSQRDLADGILVPYQRVNELVNKKRGMTPSTALRLSKFFGTTADFWMSLQLRWDLCRANRVEAAELKLIKRIKTDGEAAVSAVDEHQSMPAIPLVIEQRSSAPRRRRARR